MYILPASIRSSLVITASVLFPSGSTSLDNFKLSLVDMSVLAVLTARIIELGFWIYFMIKFFT